MVNPNQLFGIALAFAVTLSVAGAASAQQGAPGQVRIQGVPVERQTPVPPAPVGGVGLLDLREEMRQLIQSISAFARGYRPNFIVIAKDGMNLLVKRDPVDETRASPARAYMRAIDGVTEQGVFFDKRRGDRPFGMPPEEERQQFLLSMTDFAVRRGLKVFTVDYSGNRQTVDEAFKLASARKYVSLVSPVPLADTNALPTYPRRPFNENPKSILSLGQVRNYVTIRNSQPFGTEAEFTLKMHDTNYDMVVVEVFHGRRPLSRRAVETLKYKKIGTKRLVLAYMDVGSAAAYHYYWQPGWREGSPAWISAPQRDDPDRYRVEFWQPDWQQVIFGDTNSFTYGLIAQGFDGVVIDGLDTVQYFEGGGEEEEEQ